MHILFSPLVGGVFVVVSFFYALLVSLDSYTGYYTTSRISRTFSLLPLQFWAYHDTKCIFQFSIRIRLFCYFPGHFTFCRNVHTFSRHILILILFDEQETQTGQNRRHEIERKNEMKRKKQSLRRQREVSYIDLCMWMVELVANISFSAISLCIVRVCKYSFILFYFNFCDRIFYFSQFMQHECKVMLYYKGMIRINTLNMHNIS